MSIAVEGNAIRALREEAGLTQEELADRIGVIQKSVSRYERGEVEIPEHVVRAIAKVLRVRVREVYLGRAA